MDGDAGRIAPEKKSFLTQLYKAHWKELCRYVFSAFGAGPPDPQDIAQAAFAKFAALEHPEEIQNPRAYLYTTAHNIAINEKLAERRSQQYVKHQKHAADEIFLSELSPERVLIGKESYALFAEALRRMPEQQRRALVLNRFHGMTYEEIGRQCGMSTAAVQKQVGRALAECLAFIVVRNKEERR
jgi:RNA polymerase sigma factor (sigma-70 family)